MTSAPTTIGPYETIQPLGAGGVATVWLARRADLDRPVALKVMAPRHERDFNVRTRFRREAETMSTLRHPGIVHVLDYSLDAPPYYMVMEYQPGGSLKQLLARGPLTVARVLELLQPLAETLDFLHGRRMTHRDVKPSNILLGEGGQALLSDFGIARDEALAPITMLGATFGTPFYMSPEQAAGDPATAASDRYSLAVVLYEMLLGTPPFNDPDANQVLRRILHELPPSPSQRRPDLAPPPVARSLDGVFARGLAKDPDQRFGSGRELLNAFQIACQPLLAPTPPVVVPPPPPRPVTPSPPPPRPLGGRKTAAAPARQQALRRKRLGLVLALILIVLVALAISSGADYLDLGAGISLGTLPLHLLPSPPAAIRMTPDLSAAPPGLREPD